MEFRHLVDAIYLDDRVVDYLLNIVQATRDPKAFQIPIEGLLEYGASPRATLALKQASKAYALLAGRYFVTPHDLKILPIRSCATASVFPMKLKQKISQPMTSSARILDTLLSP